MVQTGLVRLHNGRIKQGFKQMQERWTQCTRIGEQQPHRHGSTGSVVRGPP